MRQKRPKGIPMENYHCWICDKLIAPVFQRETVYTLCGSCLLKLTNFLPDKRKDATA